MNTTQDSNISLQFGGTSTVRQQGDSTSSARVGEQEKQARLRAMSEEQRGYTLQMG